MHCEARSISSNRRIRRARFRNVQMTLIALQIEATTVLIDRRYSTILCTMFEAIALPGYDQRLARFRTH
jgi:hypothetical protein